MSKRAKKDVPCLACNKRMPRNETYSKLKNQEKKRGGCSVMVVVMGEGGVVTVCGIVANDSRPANGSVARLQIIDAFPGLSKQRKSCGVLSSLYYALQAGILASPFTFRREMLKECRNKGFLSKQMHTQDALAHTCIQMYSHEPAHIHTQICRQTSKQTVVCYMRHSNIQYSAAIEVLQRIMTRNTHTSLKQCWREGNLSHMFCVSVYCGWGHPSHACIYICV